MNLIEKAKKLARKTLKEQTKENGMSAFSHVIRVAQAVDGDDDRVITALLHDSEERADVSRKQLEKHGFSTSSINAIEILTRKDDETYFEHLIRIKENSLATIVKLADLRDNLKTTKRECKKTKYELAIWFLTH